MNWRRAATRYGQTPAPATPYQRAEQLWDERIGSARVQAANWRLMAFGALALAAVAMGDDIRARSRSIVTPYVVEVDRACLRGGGCNTAGALVGDPHRDHADTTDRGTAAQKPARNLHRRDRLVTGTWGQWMRHTLTLGVALLLPLAACTTPQISYDDP